MNELRITIPLEPPSVNNYSRVSYKNGVKRHYLTKEATAFKDAVYYLASGKRFDADTYEVEFCVYQGKGSRGDVDNYSKCVLDGLVDAKVIHSDAAITDLRISKRRDWDNPRTEIIVRESFS